MVIIALAILGTSTHGEQNLVVVSPQGPYVTIQEALAEANPGDSISVREGSYKGPVKITKRVSLVGQGNPVIDGTGEGTVVTIEAKGTKFKGFVVKNSGESLNREDSGLAVNASKVTVANNQLENVLFGIYLRQAHDSVIRDNRIEGKSLPIARRGDPIRVWYSHDVLIGGNVVKNGRDVVLWFSDGLKVRDNYITDGRYGLHFMYSDGAEVNGNVIIHNAVGTFLMYSQDLKLYRNSIAFNRGTSGFGLGLKDMNDVTITKNLLAANRVGSYVDNSPQALKSYVTFRQNVFAYNTSGLKMLPSIKRNKLLENNFINNRDQVSIAGQGDLKGNQWGNNEGGNYWSDYRGYDGNEDGLGDTPYRHKDTVGELMDSQPKLRLFIYSPAVRAVEFAARTFPIIEPETKLTDSRPLMNPRLPEGLPPLPDSGSGRLFLGLSSGGILLLCLVLITLPTLGVARGETLNPASDGPRKKKPAIVRAQGLTKSFGDEKAVHNVSLEAGAGKAIALWGPNGSGKTTALRCLLSLIECEGKVKINGYDVDNKRKEALRSTGYVPQELGLHRELTARETLQFYGRLKRASQSAEELLNQVGLKEHRQKLVKELSGGMKQRLSLAVALLADPPLLLLDEPTANLDVRARDFILSLLETLREEGKTIIYASHQYEEVKKLADQVLILEGGKTKEKCGPNLFMDRLGNKRKLWLTISDGKARNAQKLLKENGFQGIVERDDSKIGLDVTGKKKGKPIELLVREGISVLDFRVEFSEKRGTNWDSI